MLAIFCHTKFESVQSVEDQMCQINYVQCNLRYLQVVDAWIITDSDNRGEQIQCNILVGIG